MRLVEFELDHINYDDISRENAVIYYKGKFEDGRECELQIVYPERKNTCYYIRIDNKDFLHGQNSDIKKLYGGKSMREFVECRLADYFEEQKKNKPKPPRPKRKRKTK